MNDLVENFLAARLPIGGVVAYVVQAQQRVLAFESLTKSIYPSSAEQLLRGLVQSASTLLPVGRNAARYCWIFECLRVYIAARQDGLILALLAENDPKTQFAQIQETVQGFLELTES